MILITSKFVQIILHKRHICIKRENTWIIKKKYPNTWVCDKQSKSIQNFHRCGPHFRSPNVCFWKVSNSLDSWFESCISESDCPLKVLKELFLKDRFCWNQGRSNLLPTLNTHSLLYQQHLKKIFLKTSHLLWII